MENIEFSADLQLLRLEAGRLHGYLRRHLSRERTEMGFGLYKIVVEDYQSPEFLLFESGQIHKPLALISRSDLRNMVYRYAQEFPEDTVKVLEEIKDAGASYKR